MGSNKYLSLNSVLFATSFVIMLSSTTNGCFIRNCPPGGKRSLDVVSRGTIPCLSCGPANSGQCVGPNICCGSFGCYFGTSETQICQKENERTIACEIRGEPCGARGQGSCVTDGICCDSSACSFNDKCVAGSQDSLQLISLLNKILQTGDLD
ncbi:terepressin/terephysin-like [Ruditapes philippinarum]|uniref:terepressin/terephysin-like n=1 Tax=Ruditapes philippinarum TaxID=129788 RepID=UPI00295B88CD|nr:terepressin/terephysin-like [Ruditapes philippinarum]